ncbi:MAG: major facilitator superfamily domain-containing protein [Linnemannia gamsii]|nr:MAG: major facilitator superfamily domain-containing protein [Linnemannia gamsii]
MDKSRSSTTPSDSVITIPDEFEKTIDTPSPPSAPSKLETAPGQQNPGPPQMGNQYEIVTPPFRELIVVLIGLMLGLLLSSLDQTIVAVCTTKIANDFNSLSEIPWVGTAYLLTSTAVQPLYGRFSDIFGRKQTYLFAICIFLIGSALCGASQNMTMLIVSRGLSGVGAGGIMSTAMIIVTGLVSLRDRGKYQGLFGAVFAVSSVIGPLLGGVFSDHATWRWAFFINLPIGILTLAVIVKLLHLPHAKGSFKDKVKRIDFLGAITLVIGLTLVLLALNWGGSTHPWNSGIIIGLFCAGFAVLLVFCLIEWKQAAEPIIPFRLFKTRTNAAVFATSFFFGMGFFIVMFYMPLYFQIVRQESATTAGLEMLPLVAGMLISSISSGNMITRWGHYRPFIWLGLTLATTGIGLLTLLKVDSGRGSQIGFMLIIGLGLGMSIQNIMVAIQSAVTMKDIAVATANTTFFRTVGSVMGVAIAGTVFINGVHEHLAPIIAIDPRVEAVISNSYLAPSFGPEVERQILEAYMKALRSAFTVSIPLMGAGLLSSLFIEHHKLRRPGGPPGSQGGPSAPGTAAGRHPSLK